VRLSYAVQEDFLHETELASEKMSQFAPEALYLNVCGTREMFLQDKAQLETIYYQRSASQLNACSGTGEIYYYQGQGGILNCALVAVGFREGYSKSALTVYEAPEETEDNAPVLLSARMAAFLDAVTRELEESNRGLRDMAMETEKASIDKYRFLSRASRDIAEPLQKVMEMERRVLQESSEPHIKAYAAEGRKAGEIVYSIIQRLFDFLEMEAGNFKLNEGEYRLDHLLDSLREELAETAGEKGITLNFELEGKVPSVLYGDELRIRQILLNLLGNGLKYTLQGSVTLQLKAEKTGAAETALTARVMDTGVGMTDEQQAELQNILELNVDKKVSTLADTGIGISVSQRLLKMMGSGLKISSKLGEGSEVSFVLKQRVLSWIPLRQGETALTERSKEEKHTISPEELAENWEALREIADACERESLDYMLENLEGYTLPEREARLLLELRTAAQEENWALIQKLVQ
jgi:signal transduction histidine kinase